MPFFVLPGGGDVVINGQKTSREKLGIDVMAHFEAPVPKVQGCQYGGEMERTARSGVEPNNGAVLRAAMAVTAFVPGGDAPGDVDDEIALTLPSQRPIIFQDCEVEMRDRVGLLDADIDNAVDHGSPPECAKMLRDIVFRAHLDEVCQALSGDSPACEKPVAVRFYSGASLVRMKPPPERSRLRWSAAKSGPDCRSVVTMSLWSRWPGKGRRARRAPGSRCRACSKARRPCCEKSSGRWRWRRTRSGDSYSGTGCAFHHVVVLGGNPEF